MQTSAAAHVIAKVRNVYSRFRVVYPRLSTGGHYEGVENRGGLKRVEGRITLVALRPNGHN